MKCMTKAEIYERIQRYFEDERRPISVELFAELAGISVSLLKRIFVTKDRILTAEVQVRLSRALERLENGEVEVMRNRDNTRFIHYHGKPKPRFVRSMGLHLTSDGIKLKPGIRRYADYSQPTLKEQLDGE